MENDEKLTPAMKNNMAGVSFYIEEHKVLKHRVFRKLAVRPLTPALFLAC